MHHFAVNISNIVIVIFPRQFKIELIWRSWNSRDFYSKWNYPLMMEILRWNCPGKGWSRVQNCRHRQQLKVKTLRYWGTTKQNQARGERGGWGTQIAKQISSIAIACQRISQSSALREEQRLEKGEPLQNKTGFLCTKAKAERANIWPRRKCWNLKLLKSFQHCIACLNVTMLEQCLSYRVGL